MSRRLRWWQAWFVACALAIFLPFPLGLALAAPFAVWAGWTLLEQPQCGWCGRRFRGSDWCCDDCAAWHDDTPWGAR